MAQLLETHPGLAGDPSCSSQHPCQAAYPCLLLQPQGADALFWPLGALCSSVHTCAETCAPLIKHNKTMFEEESQLSLSHSLSQQAAFPMCLPFSSCPDVLQCWSLACRLQMTLSALRCFWSKWFITSAGMRLEPRTSTRFSDCFNLLLTMLCHPLALFLGDSSSALPWQLLQKGTTRHSATKASMSHRVNVVPDRASSNNSTREKNWSHEQNINMHCLMVDTLKELGQPLVKD